jgi:acyl homoserine lactone synthase
MRRISFDMASMHLHGSAFYNFLRLRKRLFVDTLDWDVPHNDDVEMDQYDNPVARYSLVLKDDEVVGGARTLPLDARWGQHTSMLHDAALGKLPGIPSDLLEEPLSLAHGWECTRLVIAESLTSQEARSRCLDLIVDGLATTAAANGAISLLSLSPPPLQRALRRLGHDVTRLGRVYRCANDGRSYVVLRMPALTSAMARKVTQARLRRAS